MLEKKREKPQILHKVITLVAPASKLLKTSSSTTLVKSNNIIPERIVLRTASGNRLILSIGKPTAVTKWDFPVKLTNHMLLHSRTCPGNGLNCFGVGYYLPEDANFVRVLTSNVAVLLAESAQLQFRCFSKPRGKKARSRLYY